jgi:hypothetical protein
MPAPPDASDGRAYDSTQEMRAMILAALPLPPLPVMLRRVEEGSVLGDEILQTSHDIISNLLVHACARRSDADNARRREAQTRILRDLLAALGKDGIQPPLALYATYSEFTLRHVATYLGAGDGPLPEMRILPLQHVCKGDIVHLRMCDYMAGQARLLELPEGHAAQDWLSYEYVHMLGIARNRLVFDREGAGDEEEP